MTTLQQSDKVDAQFARELVWQWPIRLFHWAFAGSVVVLFATGLCISWPWFTVAGDADRHLFGLVRWAHFVAAAVFIVALGWRIVWFAIGNRHARSGFPCPWRAGWWRRLGGDLGDYLRLRHGDAQPGHNALGGLTYVLVVLGLGGAQVVTGLAMFGESNPGGFWDGLCGWVIPLCGGSFRTHMWHHLFSWGFAVFAVLHVYVVLLDDHQYGNGLISAMFSGRKFVRRRGDERRRNDG